eukprot:Opistho-2@34634
MRPGLLRSLPSLRSPSVRPTPAKSHPNCGLLTLFTIRQSSKNCFLESVLAQYSDSGEIAWRLARAKHELALDPATSNDAKKKLVYDAHALAKRAIEIDGSNFACHKWFAITLSDVGDFEGVKVKIGNAFVIRDHFVKAIELNPKDPTSRHLLGLWCFTFAEMPWYQQKVAAALFATPPKSTYDEALGNFLQAEDIEPGFYLKNAVMIAKTYQRMGKTDEFNKWVDAALKMPVRNPSDKESHDEAVALKGGRK